MKNITQDELFKAPALVQFLYVAAASKTPVGLGMLEKAYKDHPEYFPDEIEHIKKWDAIPQSVHDEYWTERNKITAEIRKDMPVSKGIWGMINDPQYYDKWDEKNKECNELEKPLLEALHKKYYEPYGIEYNGW